MLESATKIPSMRSVVTTHLYARWLTIFVVWFACLAPTVSHAMRVGSGVMLGGICSSSGFVSAGLNSDRSSGRNDADSSIPERASGELADCPLCLLQGHGIALPSQSLTAQMPGDLRFELPRLFLQARHTLHAWSSAQARAPPQTH
jgi:hypothetical protein